jgi:carbon-monoxide dehydrogenase large subunit
MGRERDALHGEISNDQEGLTAAANPGGKQSSGQPFGLQLVWQYTAIVCIVLAISQMLGNQVVKFGIGQSVLRTEDRRFITGRARYVEDAVHPHALHVAFVRSPLPHAEIRSIDTGKAAAAPGVHAVLTGADYIADEVGGLGCHTVLPGMHQSNDNIPTPALATDKVRHVGAPVAVVIAESQMAARNAAELVEVDYRELDAVLTPQAALADAAPILWESVPDNIAFKVDLGNADATLAAISNARHVIRLSLHNNRLSANSMEMRGGVAEFDEREERLIFHASTQAPHSVRGDLARILGLPESTIRVIAPDVGGGFGMKGGIYPEDVLIGWAAWRLRQTVRWHADRSESLLADFHGRDQDVDAALALDDVGRIVALQVHSRYNTGAYLSPGAGVSPMFSSTLATGCYRIPVAHALSEAVYTNTSPTQPYRGAGRPEASYLIERLMDRAAAVLGMDRAEIRRINIITPAEMPYKTPLVYTIDSGDYGAVLDRALDIADWQGAQTRKKQAEKNGLLRGIGIALHMENAGLANETAEIRFDPSGGVVVLSGAFSHGQGHETVFAQMVTDWLGVPFDQIRVLQGDTDVVTFGRGTVASRSMINGGAALLAAADRVIEKGRAIAGHLMEVAPEDLEFEQGHFTVAGTDKKMPIQQVAQLSYKPILPPHLGLGLSGQGDFLLQGFTFPNGCQVAEVEIDPDTGTTTVVGLVSVDDVGTVINPLLLEGQLVGGIVQGIGQALLEDVIYEDQTGQLLTGSFMDYAMPRAEDLPPIRIETLPTPTLTNPLGVKGAGEAGTVGATPVIISAILDALSPLGVNDIALPATPERVWKAINGH